MHSCVEKIRGTLLHIALFAMRANSPEVFQINYAVYWKAQFFSAQAVTQL